MYYLHRMPLENWKTAEIGNALTSAKEGNAGFRRPIPPVTRDQLNEERVLAHAAFVDGEESSRGLR